MSGVTDPYQPVERRLKLTRGCLEVLAQFRNPVAIITKNHLVTRDSDLLRELAGHQAAAVFVSITTLDAALARHMEPRASAPAGRSRTVAPCSESVSVYVVVWPSSRTVASTLPLSREARNRPGASLKIAPRSIDSELRGELHAHS